MKPYSHFVTAICLLSSFSAFAVEGEFAHPRWCELAAGREVGTYINAASEFVGMDPLLLATGMASEGFVKKTNDCDYANKIVSLSTNKDDKDFNQMIADKQCIEDGFKRFNVSTTSEAEKRLGPAEWDKIKADKNEKTTYVAISPQGFTEFLTPRQTVERTYYGNSWEEDGSDTFGLEYAKIIGKKDPRYLPEKFSSSSDTAVNGDSFENMPDFVFMSDPSDRNEKGINRFLSSDGPYMERAGRQPTPQGDLGRTRYKTPEAQTFANAALWKLSRDKFESAKKELIAYYKSKPSGTVDGIIAGLERPLSPVEEAFWNKAFYNGGQGTQAAAWDMLREFASKEWLKDDSYLNRNPGVTMDKVYSNAREVSDSYAAGIKSSTCKDLLAAKGKNINVDDYKNFTANENKKKPTTNEGSTVIGL